MGLTDPPTSADYLGEGRCDAVWAVAPSEMASVIIRFASDGAREAFLQSLAFDAHDSTAYVNLGILALDERDVAAATDYFAEALWLDPESPLAREGLRRALMGAY